MRTGAAFEIDGEDGGARLRLSGAYLLSTIGAVEKPLGQVSGPVAAVDLGGITAIDTVGAWLALSTARRLDAPLENGSERTERLIRAVADTGEAEEPWPTRAPIWRRVPARMGELVVEFFTALVGVVGFIGQILLAAGALIRHPRRFRGNALVNQMEKVGVSALPIVGLMSFLIGIVIAQQGAVQLAQFGAETLTVNLVGRITLRELGVLMTAIMVAGRSGSAFAAQLGTMKLTEEIDAMRTIGISPIEALVIPRVLAAILVMPLLGFYASVMAIIGGAVIADLTLGIPFLSFIQRIQDVVPTYDLWVGLIKAPIFGLIIALSGCYQGMQVRGNSEEVGLRTTTSVVAAIFMVIVVDAFFAVFFTNVGWG
ncbi:ABC transporter permease [Erythrobacteraceae bacterium CFH 75059]|uniref:MlaE family ABC transporter permease n=1 Tax=Qipengyuania thermophila TaxID=2509361 RepID=UPI001021AE84|nr:ABC transporter permease [Qipengyuania thermophila]TCD02047.1 ABC transporter permease [Erythrobacteraceae bacterium CFH 75059]